jgi:anion-transporting  ArsA/GET3 family ATPase
MSFFDRRLLVNTGKGGVGKSTVSAALALAAAGRGKRVLVCEVNTHERISVLLGARPVGAEIGRVADGIDAIVVRPQEAMRQYGLMQLRYRAVYKAVFENRFVSRFLRFIPSLPELVMLGKILHHVREAKWDVVIVDAPATGHGIAFLRVPQVLIDTVPPGAMRSDAEWMNALLVDPKITAVNLVSLPEELPVNETIELGNAVRDTLHMRAGHVFLNRAYESRFTAEEIQALDRMLEPPALDAASNAARAHAVRAGLTDRYRAKLREGLGLPIVDIPFLAPQGDFGRPAIDAVAARLARVESNP